MPNLPRMSLPPFHRSLRGRIVGLFLGLLALVQGASWVTLRQGIERHAREQLAQQMALGERVLQRLLLQNTQVLTQGATLLAADTGFREAMLSGDTATLQSALDNQAARIGATVSALLAPDQRQIVSASVQGGGALRPLLDELGNSPDSTGPRLAVVNGQGYQFVVVPLKAPVLAGWVVLGFAFDQRLVEDLTALSGLPVALVEAAAGQPARVSASTLPEGVQAALSALPARATHLKLRQGDEFALRNVPLLASPSGHIHAVMARSVDAAIAPFATLQGLLAFITAAGLVVFGLGAVVTAQRISQPLQRLVRASRRLGQGDFDTPVPQTGRADEIGQLAQAYEQMRRGLAERTREIRQLAYWDPLTGLPNAALFLQRLRQHTARGTPVALLLLNLDRVEQVNQLLGRELGNALLREAARRLSVLERQLGERGSCPEALAARLGGDEFALLLPGRESEFGRAVARQLVQAFEAPALLDGHAVDLSAGMGLAALPEHAASPEPLIDRARRALTEAKRSKAGLLVYEPALDAGNARTLSLLSELRHALRHGELRLYLQPKRALATGRLAGAEALVRWQHPQRGLVPPAQFIPYAEETGFIHELSLWVVEEAARIWARQQAQGWRWRLSVNLSAHDLMKPDLLERIQERLLRHAVPPAALCLEITESAIALDPQRALQTLQALKAAGFKLSIDDFGAGYTSLAQLGSLPVDELKIDMLFVRTMDRDADKAAMVRSLIGLAHDRRLSVVAEGVENGEIEARLRALGADEAQGWHIGKPMPAAELPAWARAQGETPVEPAAPAARDETAALA